MAEVHPMSSECHVDGRRKVSHPVLPTVTCARVGIGVRNPREVIVFRVCVAACTIFAAVADRVVVVPLDGLHSRVDQEWEHSVWVGPECAEIFVLNLIS